VKRRTKRSPNWIAALNGVTREMATTQPANESTVPAHLGPGHPVFPTSNSTSPYRTATDHKINA
jgi:hypothetical protein